MTRRVPGVGSDFLKRVKCCGNQKLVKMPRDNLDGISEMNIKKLAGCTKKKSCKTMPKQTTYQYTMAILELSVYTNSSPHAPSMRYTHLPDCRCFQSPFLPLYWMPSHSSFHCGNRPDMSSLCQDCSALLESFPPRAH